jgi:hypothetical protein
MNTRAKATTEHVERVRATGEAYLKIQADFPRVVLDYGRALLKARSVRTMPRSASGSPPTISIAPRTIAPR